MKPGILEQVGTYPPVDSVYDPCHVNVAPPAMTGTCSTISTPPYDFSLPSLKITLSISHIMRVEMADNPTEQNADQEHQVPNGTQADSSDHVPPPPAIPESRLPTHKDTSLKELLNKMDDYAPIVRLRPTSRLLS